MSGLLTWWLVGGLLTVASWRRYRGQITFGLVFSALLVVGSPVWLGLFGSLSYGTVGLAAATVCQQKPDTRLSLWLSASGILLYLSVLGVWALDLYSLGYAPRALLLWVGCSLLLCWWLCPALALAWLVGLSLRILDWVESVNLWDIMIDPFIVLFALAHLLYRTSQQVWERLFYTTQILPPTEHK